MSSSSARDIAQQFINGGVLPADLVGQDAATKGYVDTELAKRDTAIQNNTSTASSINTKVDTHIANASVHVTPAEKDTYNGHIANTNIHVTTTDKNNWNSKAPGSVQTDLQQHVGNTDIHTSLAEKTKLAGIQTGAEVNQNAFSKVNDVNATGKTDALTLTGGTGITVTTNPSSKTVIFTATGDATPGPHALSHITGGTDVIPDAVIGGNSGLMSGADAQFVRVDGETITGAQSKANAVQTNLDTHTADGKAHGIGDKTTLLTTEKTTIVGALNELFTNANSLKSDWAGVIGSPLLSSDTSAQLKSKTQTIKNTLATNLTAKGQSASGTETLTSLVNKVANVNTGKRIAVGTLTTSPVTTSFLQSNGTTFNSYYAYVNGLTFKPSYIFVYELDGEQTIYNSAFNMAYRIDRITNRTGTPVSLTVQEEVYPKGACVTATEFQLPVTKSSTVYKYFAIE